MGDKYCEETAENIYPYPPEEGRINEFSKNIGAKENLPTNAYYYNKNYYSIKVCHTSKIIDKESEKITNIVHAIVKIFNH